MNGVVRLTSHISSFTSHLYQYIWSQPLLKDTITTTALSTVGKGAGFLIPFFIAAWFGVTTETDAFFFAYGLIIFLSTIFSPVVETIIVPFIADAKAKHEDVGTFVGRILGMSAIGLIAISGIFLLAIRPVLSVMTKFSPEGLDLVYWILLESAPLIILLVWTSVLAGTLNAYRMFGIPALSPALRAVVTLSFIFTFKEEIGVHAIAWGYVSGEIFRLSVLLVFLKKLNIFQLRLSIVWESKFAEFFKSSSYQIIGMSTLALAPIINKTMAVWLGPGNISLLEYAERLYMIAGNLLLLGLAITALSHWSDKFYGGQSEQLVDDVSRVAKWISLISLGAAIIFIFLRQQIVSLAYAWGDLTKDQLDSISNIFVFFLLGLIFNSLHHVYMRAQLVKRNTKIILKTAIVMTISNVMLNLIFMSLMGVTGIAIATSLVYGLSAWMLGSDFYTIKRGIITGSIK